MWNQKVGLNRDIYASYMYFGEKQGATHPNKPDMLPMRKKKLRLGVKPI